MTIQELIDEAFRVDPSLRLEVTDYSTYSPNKGVVRETVAMVTHKDHGMGSAEAIRLRMKGDEVIFVIPGKTTTYWQGAPLVDAFEKLLNRGAVKAG